VKSWRRWGCFVAALALALAGQSAWRRHVSAAATAPPVQLSQPLAALPLMLGQWVGQDEPILDPRHLYADQHLKRIYVNRKTQQVVSVWAAFSTVGSDRGHHPEACLAVAGQEEDRRVRTTLDLPGDGRPVQQYRFVAAGHAQWVFYWHYSLPRPTDDRVDFLQAAYRNVNTRTASVTLEVFTPEHGPQDVEGARDFVRLLDAAAQPIVGPGAERGSKRIPVTLVPGE
jgi:hypothetical protein